MKEEWNRAPISYDPLFPPCMLSSKYSGFSGILREWGALWTLVLL